MNDKVIQDLNELMAVPELKITVDPGEDFRDEVRIEKNEKKEKKEKRKIDNSNQFHPNKTRKWLKRRDWKDWRDRNIWM